MSNDTKNMSNVSKKEKISPICWPNYFWFAFATVFIGGLCISIAASDGNRLGDLNFFYWIGLCFIVVSIFFSIELLKEIIAEASVRAREVYYGKPRVVKRVSEQESGQERTWSWGE